MFTHELYKILRQELSSLSLVSSHSFNSACLCFKCSLSTLQELDKAWKMVDAAHDKEKSDKETIRRLTEEVTNLTKMAEQQTGFSMDQEQR